MGNEGRGVKPRGLRSPFFRAARSDSQRTWCKHEQYAIAKTVEISAAVGNAFEDLDFVVTAFYETVGTRSGKGIEDLLFPAKHGFCTGNNGSDPTIQGRVNPKVHFHFGVCDGGRTEDHLEFFLVKVRSGQRGRNAQHHIYRGCIFRGEF